MDEKMDDKSRSDKEGQIEKLNEYFYTEFSVQEVFRALNFTYLVPAV